MLYRAACHCRTFLQIFGPNIHRVGHGDVVQAFSDASELQVALELGLLHMRLTFGCRHNCVLKICEHVKWGRILRGQLGTNHNSAQIDIIGDDANSRVSKKRWLRTSRHRSLNVIFDLLAQIRLNKLDNQRAARIHSWQVDARSEAARTEEQQSTYCSLWPACPDQSVRCRLHS